MAVDCVTAWKPERSDEHDRASAAKIKQPYHMPSAVCLSEGGMRVSSPSNFGFGGLRQRPADGGQRRWCEPVPPGQVEKGGDGGCARSEQAEVVVQQRQHCSMTAGCGEAHRRIQPGRGAVGGGWLRDQANQGWQAPTAMAQVQQGSHLTSRQSAACYKLPSSFPWLRRPALATRCRWPPVAMTCACADRSRSRPRVLGARVRLFSGLTGRSTLTGKACADPDQPGGPPPAKFDVGAFARRLPSGAL